MKNATSPDTASFLVAVLLLAIILLPVSAQAAPRAGTVIGNQASASYTDSSNVSRITTSNTVTTVVQQVGALTLAASGSKFSNPGGTVYYPHTITNTGNGSDSFSLGLAAGAGAFSHTGLAIYADANGDGIPDNSTDLKGTTVGPIPADGVYHLIVAGSVPSTATNGQTGTMTVTVTSSFDAGVTGSNIDTTTITGNGVIAVTKAMSLLSGAPGVSGITVTLTYTNTGNSTATSVTLADALPAGFTYTNGSGRWSATGSAALSDADKTDLEGTAPNQIIYDYSVTTASTVTAVLSQVAPGQSGTLSFQVSLANGTAPGILNNTATFTYDPDGPGGTPSTSSTNTNTVTFIVSQTASVVANGSGTVNTNGSGEPVTVPSALQGATVSFSDYIWNLGNGSDSFDLAITASTFPAGTTFIIFKTDGTTPLVDTTGNSIADTGPVAAGSPYQVIIKATLPVTASAGGPYTVTLTATSAQNSTIADTVINRLTTIIASTADLTYSTPRIDSTPAGTATTGSAGFGAGPEASPVVTIAVNPGQTTAYPLYINNTSAVADSYNLLASTDSTFAATTLPSGWTVEFKADGGSGNCSTTGATLTNSGVVANGTNHLVCAVVTVPAAGAGAAAGNTELYFQAKSPTTGATDSLHVRQTVNAVRSLSITPNNNGQIFPGGTVVYKHTIANPGNVVEGDGSGSSVTFSTSDAPSPVVAGWSSQVYWDMNNDGTLDASDPLVTTLANLTGGTNGASIAAGLDPGESATIFVKVQAPAGANTSDTNTTTVRATAANVAYTSTLPAIATATEISSVINGQITLVKEQALDAGCTGSGPFTYGTTNLSTGAVPGACIRYRITATNVGAANVSALVISDATPTNTVYDDGSRNSAGGTCGSGAVDAGAATTVGSITAAPACDAGGTIAATIGTLTPSQTAIITFGVMIGK